MKERIGTESNIFAYVLTGVGVEDCKHGACFEDNNDNITSRKVSAYGGFVLLIS
jgi:hypothetical protein